MDENKIRAEIEFEIKEQIRERQRAYKREWRKKNPDKIKAANERYWLKKAEEVRRMYENGKKEK